MKTLAVLLAAFFASATGKAPPAASLPAPAAFAQQVTSGRLDPETFDFAAAGYWQLSQQARMDWWQAAAAALRFGQPNNGDPCSLGSQRESASIAWLLLPMQAKDASEWADAAQILRKKLATLDAELAAAAPAPKPGDDPRVNELSARFARDQAVRAVLTQPRWLEGLPPLAANNWSVAFISRWTTIDCSNTAWLKKQLAEIRWFDIPTYGADADTAAWHLVQHADREPAFQRRMLQELEALPPGKTDPKRLGYLWDRVALADKRLQRYGTQGQCTNGVWKPHDVEDPQHLDARRARLGMEPIAEHAQLVSREACPR